ncbi:hypothetical protein [Paenibacillus sp. p3-SID867]|nr:hypothetical protein [Paenibacillus sp. p3-SID867]
MTSRTVSVGAKSLLLVQQVQSELESSTSGAACVTATKSLLLV